MKITVICRVEPGCLGPDGADHVEKFCILGQKEFNKIDPDQIQWKIIPRFDKNKPEIQYKLNGRYLNKNQSVAYLRALGKSQDKFEEILFKQLSDSVNHYFGRY
ncbi:MAG: hypothetical protein ACJA0E_000181 [Bermanella sp.]|jgi:hypothetical protein